MKANIKKKKLKVALQNLRNAINYTFSMSGKLSFKQITADNGKKLTNLDDQINDALQKCNNSISALYKCLEVQYEEIERIYKKYAKIDKSSNEIDKINYYKD